MKTKIKSIDSESIDFDNGYRLESYHGQDCCEHHWLEFDYIKLDEVKDLEFDLSDENFFKRIDGYGIELIPVSGFSVKVPGYGSNNGYYSSEITLILSNNGKEVNRWDVSECQVISD